MIVNYPYTEVEQNMEERSSYIYDRTLNWMLMGIDERVIELFGLYEYKPSPKANETYLGIGDKDFIKYFMKFGYSVRAEGYNPRTNEQFMEFTVTKNNYWKVRKILFKFMRSGDWDDYFDDALGEDWREWAFNIRKFWG